MTKFLTLILLTTLALTGCTDRQKADAMLSVACQAAINAALLDGQQIDKIAHTDFSSPGEGMRALAVTASLKDDPAERPYDCVFEEDFGFMHIGYLANIHSVTAGARTIGKTGDGISSSMEDFIRVEEAVQKALP